MIRGIGVDTIELTRVSQALTRPRFLERVFTDGERTHITQKGTQSAAGIFAAKEAIVKALGTGFTGAIGFHSVEISHDEKGAPVCALHGAARESAGGARVFVSISHDRAHAVAFAVIEEEDKP